MVPANSFGSGFSHSGWNGQFGNRASFAGSSFAIWARPFVFGVVPRIEKLQEDPLSPAVVIWVGGGDFSRPVVAKAQHLQLAFEGRDVLFGGFSRMRSCFNRVFFGGQSKAIPAHGVQNIFAIHAFEAADDISGRIAFWVTHVETASRRVRKHVEGIHFGFGTGCWFGLERRVLFPVVLPGRFDSSEVVTGHDEAGQQSRVSDSKTEIC